MQKLNLRAFEFSFLISIQLSAQRHILNGAKQNDITLLVWHAKRQDL